MLEHRVPCDIATELAGTIECVVADYLRTAIEYVESASRVTADELGERHRGEQALLRRFRGRI